MDHETMTAWERAPSPLGFARTWAMATFRPRPFVDELGHGGSLAKAAAFGAIGVSLAAAIVAAVTVGASYSSLHRFDATGSLGRVVALQLGWHLGQVTSALVAATMSTWLVAKLARRPAAAALRVRMYTLGPLTFLIAWWVMFRWLEREAAGPSWRPKALALGGWIAELALAAAISSLLTSLIRDAVFAALYG